MTTAIMQPYLFPYIGYFQLMEAADTFVVLDDVNFINKGWVNRNRILVNGQLFLFTIPLVEASQNKKINEIRVETNSKWRAKFLKTIEQAYKKAPYFNDTFGTIENVIQTPTDSLTELILESFRILMPTMGIACKVVESSSIYQNQHLKAQERIIDIVKQTQASQYINAIGGRDLYDKQVFENEDITLFFQQSIRQEYPQFKPEFVPWLSIIDVLMFNSPEQVKQLLRSYELV